MKILILREGRSGLEQVDAVTVPDNSADPETVGWNTWTRASARDKGDYSVVRAGKKFAIVSKPQNVSQARGLM